ncbi:hypothetical protein ACLBSM_27260, partial [Klebsiella pneumoniae]
CQLCLPKTPCRRTWYGADVRLVQHPDNAVPQVYLAP